MSSPTRSSRKTSGLVQLSTGTSDGRKRLRNAVKYSTVQLVNEESMAGWVALLDPSNFGGRATAQLWEQCPLRVTIQEYIVLTR